MIPQLIIFDFDGTIADTTEIILTTYRMTISQMNMETRTDAECQATIGLPLKEGFRRLYPEFSDDRLVDCVATYRRIFSDNKRRYEPRLYPGVIEALDRLASLGVEMAIASSRSRESLVEFSENMGIKHHFTIILGADDVVHAKPDPEPVETILKRLDQCAERTIVVGDMPVDIVMGRSAGCATVGVTYGNSSRSDLHVAGADNIIDSFPQLLECIDSYSKNNP